MRRAAKVDVNQPEIVEALRWKGATVAHTHQLGKGFPDILAGVPGGLFNLLFEIKSGSGTLTPDEGIFHVSWRGQVDVVRTPEEAMSIYDDYVHLTTLLKGTMDEG